ncbi:MAG: B12-binding domain-containing radical SAM protein, partial [Candidatus Omnitrophica bacterium]|nr:B12-binding domain-containing radical SAM protein [Candidatus Omnitrophota bacterium]MBU1996949.1 B12-binding domain-containing radical SAM protein [Candidatus Omnitrophota bacterium]MBU4334624.1 B12-binding domain-containing radical SAM protein [Candidatus Omnitrophota bacterium]
MKIAFINDWDQHLGIQFLSAMLKQDGHEVKVFTDPRLFNDLYISIKPLQNLFDFKNDIVKELKEYSPDLIGFSAASPHYQWACEIAQLIKNNMDVPIIIGGIHPTSVPERVIKKDCFDMLCVGEGEYPLKELVNSMQQGKIDHSIRNIWFKKDGQIIKNEIRPYWEDLDSLPFPDLDIFSSCATYATKTYVTVTSRGCPFSCNYCSMSFIHQLYKGKGKPYRVRSVENVIGELVNIKSKFKKLKRIMFDDNCFGRDIAWLKQFSNEYSQKIGVNFFCVMHPKDITEESIAYLKEAGCKAISLGIQTWDENIRTDLFNRRVSNEVMEKAIKLILNHKIDVLLDNLFDVPYYSNDDLIKHLEFYTRCKPTRNYFYRLHYYPNTALSQKAVSKGWISPEAYENCLEGGNELGTLKVDPEHKSIIEKRDKELRKIEVLFIIMDLIPARLTKYIIKKCLYKHFPVFLSPSLLTILRTLLVFDFESVYFRSTIFWRYFIFIKKKSLKPFCKTS